MRQLLQSYLERAFFYYLGDQIGIDTFIDFIYQPSEPDDTLIEQRSGVPFSELVEDWRNQLLSTYLSDPENAILAARYREEPAVRAQRICAGNQASDFSM